MTKLEELPSWQALARHRAEIGEQHMRDLFAADPQRFERFSLRMDDILFDYSKNRVTEETLRLLFDLARHPAVGDHHRIGLDLGAEISVETQHIISRRLIEYRPVHHIFGKIHLRP